ncbi:MAG: hypothetical protein K6F94_09165 [Bacteroidaceae bacterium]|nr:hypothetical protein [Bacteroidaceae bacterium]
MPDNPPDNPPDGKERKRKEEEFPPQTPLLEERKDKKKEKPEKIEREKYARARGSEFEGPIVEGQSETPEEQPCARASTANSDGGYAAEGQQRQQGARASTAAEGAELEQILDRKRRAFWEQLQPYVERYGAEVVQSFYAHWVKYNRETGKMDYESDPKFEIKIYLHEWYLNRQMIRGRYGRGGSVAQEISAEKQQQQRRMREQESVLRVERERERLRNQMESVPHLFITMVKEEGVDLAAVNADGITAIIQKRIDAHMLSSEDLQTFTDWQTRRNNAAEALRRLEAG